MWIGSEPTYREVCAFLMGCDAATEFTLLSGFREWLVVRIDGPNNFHWIGLPLFAHLSEERRGQPHTAEEERLLIDAIWEAVLGFLDERNDFGGDVRIFERYIRWRDSKPWNDDSPIGSLNELEGRICSFPPSHASDDAQAVHRARRIPVSALSAAECAKFVSLWLNLESIVPRSTQLLTEARPAVEDDDLVELLSVLIELGPEWWAGHANYLGDLRRALADTQLDERLDRSWADLLAAVPDTT